MTRFDFETWFSLRRAEEELHRKRRQAQFQNTKDHDFYDGDPTYSQMPNMFEAPSGDGGPNQGLGPQETREDFETSNVTNAIPSEAVADFAPAEDIKSTNEFETINEIGPEDHGVWDSMEGSPAHQASIRVRADHNDILQHFQMLNPLKNTGHDAPGANWAAMTWEGPVELNVHDPRLEDGGTTGYLDMPAELDTIRQYAARARTGSPFPPIIVVETRNGELGISDGSHRLEAARLAGLKTIPAYIGRRRKRQADVAIMHPERYESNDPSSNEHGQPGFENGQLTNFYPNETVDPSTPGEEGEERFEDMDVYQFPRGRPSTMSPGTSSDMLDGTLGSGDHDLQGQTPHGFQEHEAEQGASLSDLTSGGREDSPLGVSPRDPMDWMGRAAGRRADLRTSVRITARQRSQVTGNVEEPHE